IYKINEYLKVDSYGKYCLTNLAGKETSLPENQSVKFDSEHLQKVKIGSRIIHEVESKDKRSSSVFMGGGFEYYLHNDFNTSIMGKRVEAPEIGGGCGVIEAGFVTCIGNVNVDLCASYCNGRAKDSIDGVLKFMYAFL
ncbi:MAG: hypothetical protein LBU10_02145, partial [Endomicrobium sp.]|nr:hypothetical protein [Endomicrobium sp.]